MAIVSTKVLEQLTQRFQRYKKDVNATLIALYKDTKKLLQNQELDPEILNRVVENENSTPVKKEQVKDENQESEQKRKESFLKKRRHEDKDDDDY